MKNFFVNIFFILIFCGLRSTSSTSAAAAAFLEDMDAAPMIRTEYVDPNNLTILARFNLTDAQLSRIRSGSNPGGKNQPEESRTSNYHNRVKQIRLDDIRSRLQSAFNSSNSDEGGEHPQHEVAAYPICNSESNAASWLQDNNVTIQFSNSIIEKRENLNLDSAILRLYKMNPNGGEPTPTLTPGGDDYQAASKARRCADQLLVDSQIRVTVSLVQQLRRNKQRKKRICNTIMMNVSKTGWVEIDIKRAIYIWENVVREQHVQQLPQTRPPVLVGWLLIEVHDEEERPLKPGLFFKPPNCEQIWQSHGTTMDLTRLCLVLEQTKCQDLPD